MSGQSAENDAHCPGCGHSCCPNKHGRAALECGGDSDAVRECESAVSCAVCTAHYDPRAVVAARHCQMCHASVLSPAREARKCRKAADKARRMGL